MVYCWVGNHKILVRTVLMCEYDTSTHGILFRGWEPLAAQHLQLHNIIYISSTEIIMKHIMNY